MTTRKTSRRVCHGGVTYYAQREALARDGGNPARQWYWVVEDEHGGAMIDQRVPEDYFPTLKVARAVLASHLGLAEGAFEP